MSSFDIYYDSSIDDWTASDGHWYGNDIMGDPPKRVDQIVDEIVTSYGLLRCDQNNPNIKPGDFILEIGLENFFRSLNQFKNHFNYSTNISEKLKIELNNHIQRINSQYLIIDTIDIDKIISYF